MRGYLDCISLMISDAENYLTVDHLYVFYEKNAYSNPLPILNLIFLLLNCISFLYFLGSNPLSDTWFAIQGLGVSAPPS